MAQWYYGDNGQQNGPVDDGGIRSAIAAGQLTPTTLVWREGMLNWLPLSQVPELSGTVIPSGYNQSYAPQGYAAPQGYGYVAPTPTSGLAIASMVCGIVGLFTCYFCALLGIPAVICGHMALNRIAESPVPVGGRGMAITGLILGYLWIGCTVVGIGVAIFAISSQPH